MSKPAVAFESSITAYPCRVISITSLNTDTYEVELLVIGDKPLAYQAGQYLKLELVLKGEEQPQTLFYSIANGFNPEQPHRLQLFIQVNSELSGKVVAHLLECSKSEKTVTAVLAMGRAYLQTSLESPHILVAAGSGISQVKCLYETIQARKPDTQVHIYWSNRRIEDFYLFETLQTFVEQNHNARFVPILESPNTDWEGRSGYIYEVIQKDFNSLNDLKMYLCGSPQMVYGTMDQLESSGLRKENCYSDVFEYAPRQKKLAV